MHRVSVVIPAYNEGDHITPVLDRILEAVTLPCEILVVVDDENDNTVTAIARATVKSANVRCVVNTYGRGPANAIRFGIDAATAPVAVVTMADGCDDPFQQVGGPWIKASLSRLAGLSLHYLARVGTRDATNSFKAYSTDFVKAVGIESDRGFEIGIEMVAKARRHRLPVAEIPTIWLDRAFGESNFHLKAWLPRYLKWYFYAYGPRLELSDATSPPQSSTDQEGIGSS